MFGSYFKTLKYTNKAEALWHKLCLGATAMILKVKVSAPEDQENFLFKPMENMALKVWA